MPKNTNKRIPLNIDLEKLLANFTEKPDISEYEERRESRATYSKEWAQENWESCKTAKCKYNHSEKGKANYKAYAAEHREQLNANSRAYYQRHLEEMRRRGRERYHRKKRRRIIPPLD